MLRAAIRSVLAHKVRLLLTALSVVLGVGFVTGTYVLTDTMNAAFDELFHAAAAGSDVVVRATSAFQPAESGPGGGGADQRKPVPASLLRTVQSVDGVTKAVGEVSGYAQMVDPSTGKAIGGVGPPTIGSNWTETNA